MSTSPPIKTSWAYGTRPVVTGVFTDATGASATPTSVTVLVLNPLRVVVGTYNSPDATISVGATTIFTFPHGLIDQAGTWTVRMKGTAGVDAAEEIELEIRATKFPNP